MYRGSFAVLCVIIFLAGVVPLLIQEPSGSAYAGLTAGFVVPVGNVFQVAAFLAIGLLAAWFGQEAAILLPLGAILMMTIGSMMQMDTQSLPPLRFFTACAIVLFSMTVSLLRKKSFLLSVPLIGIGMYYMGQGYMAQAPSVSSPLYFMLGTLISVTLMMAIGVSLGVTLTDSIHEYLRKMKTLPAVSSFLSFF